jgi:hypothetical protein
MREGDGGTKAIKESKKMGNGLRYEGNFRLNFNETFPLVVRLFVLR